MAAPPPSDVSVKNADEENMSSEMETEKCSTADHEAESEKGDLPLKTEPEIADPFKKPAIFAAPSLASKRGNVNVTAPSKPAEETRSLQENNKADVEDTSCEVSSTSVDESKTPVEGQENNTNGDKDKVKDVAPVKTKPRVILAKGPPTGNFPPIPYTEPPWGGKAPDVPYSLEILKNGSIVDTVPLTHTSYFVVGRLPVCDISLEHPSISRYHAVIQYRGQPGEMESVGEGRGFYIHDLGSTHGTVVNKNKIPPKTYIRLRVGHVLKFGGSTRLFVLQVMLNNSHL